MTSQVEYTETHVVFHVPEGAFRLDAALFSQSGVLLREQVFFGLSVIFSEPEDEDEWRFPLALVQWGLSGHAAQWSQS
jgi:hypothetical protein